MGLSPRSRAFSLFLSRPYKQPGTVGTQMLLTMNKGKIKKKKGGRTVKKEKGALVGWISWLKHRPLYQKVVDLPWPVLLSGWSIGPCTKASWVHSWSVHGVEKVTN